MRLRVCDGGLLRLAAGLGLAACFVLVGPAATARAATSASACTPAATILKSPRAGAQEVQAKAINDRGDIVGFSDSGGGSGRGHAILWKRGAAAGAVDLGVLPGYVASEAYGINDDRVVFGLLYDAKERTVPFRWENGRMTVLKGPNGRLLYSENPGAGGRNAINARGEMAWTMIVNGNRRAVRWTPAGKAIFLQGLPGHAWTTTFGINDAGIVSGWSRRLPNEDDEENPVLWTRAGKVVALKTVQGQSDGIAEATNSSGLTVGYLGNQAAGVAERDQFAVWSSRAAHPQLFGPLRDNVVGELADVNDRGEAVGTSGLLNPQTGFVAAHGVIWRTGWSDAKPLAVPSSANTHAVLVTSVNDVNDHGAIVGTVYGLAAKDYGALRAIYPVVWTCAFGRT
jgi:probable HAF family extracellular repeat protein